MSRQTPLKLTPTSFIVLGLIEKLGGASPYDLKSCVATSVGNFWSVPHSQIYREVDRLEQACLLDCRQEQTAGGRRRKIYTLTAQGVDALAEFRITPPEAPPELRDPGLLMLFLGAEVKPLAKARLALHKQKLAEYEQMNEQDSGPDNHGIRHALVAGIGHEREWVRFWSDLAG